MNMEQPLENPLCQRNGCSFFKHSDTKNNGGTHCCASCKKNGTHGLLCEGITTQVEEDRKWCIEHIDKVIYINLDSRVDRKIALEKNLAIFPKEKLVRFSAIKERVGGIGCCKSHLGALQEANKHGWKNVLILEDDAKIGHPSSFSLLKKFMQKKYDAILLGSHSSATYNKQTFRVTHALSSHAYLVNKHYYPKLLHHFKQGVNGYVRTGDDVTYSVDRYWDRLMCEDIWYRCTPSIMIQDNSYSNITGTRREFGPYFFL